MAVPSPDQGPVGTEGVQRSILQALTGEVQGTAPGPFPNHAQALPRQTARELGWALVPRPGRKERGEGMSGRTARA